MTPSVFVEPSMQVKKSLVILRGTINFGTVVKILRQGLALIEERKKIQVDLSSLQECDSSVLSLCIAWLRAAKRQSKQVVFLNVPPFMKNLIRVYGLDSMLPIEP